MSSTRPACYRRALRFDGFTRLYDPLAALGLGARHAKRRLVEQVAAAPGERVLDVGCGTATFSTGSPGTSRCPVSSRLGIATVR